MSTTPTPARKYKLTAKGLFRDQVLIERPNSEDFLALASSTVSQVAQQLDRFFSGDTVKLRFNDGGALEFSPSDSAPAAQYTAIAHRFDNDRLAVRILRAWCALGDLASLLSTEARVSQGINIARFIANTPWAIGSLPEEPIQLPWPTDLAVFKSVSASEIALKTGCEIHLSNEGDMVAYFADTYSLKLTTDPALLKLLLSTESSLSRHEAVLDVPGFDPASITVSSILGGTTVFRVNATVKSIDLFEGLSGYEFQARHGSSPAFTATSKDSKTNPEPSKNGEE